MNMNMMNEQNPKIEVAHTRDEMLHILETMRTEGFHKEDIHIIAKDSQQLEDVKWDDDVHTHEAGNWVDQFKSWFTGDSAVTEGLKRFNLSEDRIVININIKVLLNRFSNKFGTSKSKRSVYFILSVIGDIHIRISHNGNNFYLVRRLIIVTNH